MKIAGVFLIVVVVVNGAPSSIGPHTYASNRDRHGEAGASAVNIPQTNGNADLFYGRVSGPTGPSWCFLYGCPWKGEVGLVDVGSRDRTVGARASTKFATAGVEVGPGVMGRASLTEGTVGLGPADLNIGIGADTGIIFDRGLEVKYLGIGGKIGANGIQACFIFCIGFSW